MTVKEVKQSAEEKAAEAKSIKDKGDEAMEDVFSSLDLPGSKKEDKSTAGEGDEVIPESTDAVGEEENDISDADLLETPDEELTEEGISRKRDLEEDPSKVKKEDDDGEEELIPKSKVDKMLKRQEKRIDALVRKNKISEATKSKSAEASDPMVTKLEAKTIPELKSLKREVRVRQGKLGQMDDREAADKKLDDLVDLEMKIDNAITSSPQRFVDKQVTLFNEKAAEIYEDEDIEDIDAAAPEIKKIANGIFSEYPKLREVEDGQALALGLAVDHYKALQKETSGKSKVKMLKRQQNKIKRKTSLDTSKVKGALGKSTLQALRKKAYAGTSSDKETLVLNDPQFAIDQLVPDEYKNG